MAQVRVNTPASPYFLPANENPSLILVTEVLTRPNYRQWSRCMRIALISKNKYGFVDGSIEALGSTDQHYNVWRNTMVQSWIMHAVSPQIGQSTVYLENAKAVWDDLKARFSQGDNIRIAELQREIQYFKQGNLSISNYFTQMKILWDELHNFRPLPKCSCDPVCSCDAITRFRNYQDSDQVITFLIGLNPNFSTICSQILLMEPLPNLNRVFNFAIQYERQINPNSSSLTSNPTPEPTTFIAFNTGQHRSSNNSHNTNHSNRNATNNYQNNTNRKTNNSYFKQLPTCTHYGKEGHTEDICYRKHEFPPGYGNRNNANKQRYTKANQVNVQYENDNDEIEDGDSSHDDLDENDNEVFNLTRAQYNEILSLIPQKQSRENGKNKQIASANNHRKITMPYSVPDPGFDYLPEDWIC
ncbi:uncharacterized protein [Euphorbia lathyris]|uniref:uncharacterized protein isoform X2 n=1 Tax=Euphorbia lathyris TaxID=212925 RepID=UPI003313D9A7